MLRIHVVVEGETEESFIRNVLAPTFHSRLIFLNPIILGQPGHKGGNTNYARVRKDVLTILKQDQTACCSTMLGLYGLGKGFPGTPLPENLPNLQKVERIEQAFRTDIVAQAQEWRADARFLPYIQLHEFEGLLFSDPPRFAAGIRQPHLATRFTAVRAAFATPEDINEGVNTAPSKQVEGIYPAYRKAVDGTLAAQAVGIETMRRECTHFRTWLERMNAWG
jgi:hypothetical protein